MFDIGSRIIRTDIMLAAGMIYNVSIMQYVMIFGDLCWEAEVHPAYCVCPRNSTLETSRRQKAARETSQGVLTTSACSREDNNEAGSLRELMRRLESPLYPARTRIAFAPFTNGDGGPAPLPPFSLSLPHLSPPSGFFWRGRPDCSRQNRYGRRDGRTAGGKSRCTFV